MAPGLRPCKFFVTRKKRNCRMLVKETEEYCPEHEMLSGKTNPDTNKLRIPCPLDNTHTCYAFKLNKHLKVCNANKVETGPYIVKGINCLDSDNESDCSKTLSEYSHTEISNVIKKVEQSYKELLIEITEKICTQSAVEKELENPIYGIKTKRHLKQVSSILGLLEKLNLIDKETCVVEFGAGRGHLSYWISEAFKNFDVNILLVEKASPKHKKDNKLDKSNDKIKRLRVDIGDLVLDKVDVIEKTQHIVGVTKHLCGVATDLAIRCLTNMKDNIEKLSGLVMTFCCHHQCKWSSYIGREYLENVGFAKSDFQIMCGMVSWAVCGSGFSREKRKLGEDKNEGEINGLSREEKTEIGLKCKQIINWEIGRAHV